MYELMYNRIDSKVILATELSTDSGHLQMWLDVM